MDKEQAIEFVLPVLILRVYFGIKLKIEEKEVA